MKVNSPGFDLRIELTWTAKLGSFQTLQVLESNTNLNKTLEQFEFGRVTYEEVEVEKGVCKWVYVGANLF